MRALVCTFLSASVLLLISLLPATVFFFSSRPVFVDCHSTVLFELPTIHNQSFGFSVAGIEWFWFEKIKNETNDSNTQGHCWILHFIINSSIDKEITLRAHTNWNYLHCNNNNNSTGSKNTNLLFIFRPFQCMCLVHVQWKKSDVQSRSIWLSVGIIIFFLSTDFCFPNNNPIQLNMIACRIFCCCQFCVCKLLKVDYPILSKNLLQNWLI